MDGIILIDKPKNFTSFDVVNFIKKKFGLKKVGHAGTLDPLATGLLIILVGKATRCADTFFNYVKKYIATMALGVTTDTFDVTGKIIEENKNIPPRQKIIDALKSFEGEIEQTPPVFSALKYKGQAMYKLARCGKIVLAKKRKVVIHRIEKIKCLSPLSSEHSLFRVDTNFSNRRNKFKYCYENAGVMSNLPEVFFEVKCSKGTYIRSLCNDAGEILGCGAVLKELRRIEIGKFKIKDAVTLNSLENMKERGDIAEILLTI